jgi:hypothetical protein
MADGWLSDFYLKMEKSQGRIYNFALGNAKLIEIKYQKYG